MHAVETHLVQEPLLLGMFGRIEPGGRTDRATEVGCYSASWVTFASLSDAFHKKSLLFMHFFGH
jgi:hypothetical protein